MAAAAAVVEGSKEGRKEEQEAFLPSGIIIISSQPAVPTPCCRKLPGRGKRKWGREEEGVQGEGPGQRGERGGRRT